MRAQQDLHYVGLAAYYFYSYILFRYYIPNDIQGKMRAPYLTAATANVAINTCAGTRDPNGGPLLSMPPAWNRQRQYSGLWWDGGQFSPTLTKSERDFLMQQTPDPLTEVGDLLFVHAESTTWWTVDLWGMEVSRYIEFGLPGVSSLSQGEVIAENRRFTRIKARVTWENTQVPRSVDVDVGPGTRFSVAANAVRVTPLIPKNHMFVEVGTTTNTARDNNIVLPTGNSGGLVLDSIIGGSIYPCFSPSAGTTATYTQTIRQLSSNDPGVVPQLNVSVPPAAKRVSIYVQGDPFLSPWYWVVASAGSSTPDLGPSITFDASLGAVANIGVPQNVIGILMPAPAAMRRTWTIVWDLEL